MARKKPRLKKTGFTLAEVLIVIVIISVMASLVIPRFLGQTEKAKTAEAINMMSAIRRGMINYLDANANVYPAAISAHCGGSGAGGAQVDASIDSIQKLFGVKVPICNDSSWSYSTDDAGKITATRKKKGTETGQGSGSISLSDTGIWTGSGDYCNANCSPGEGKYWPF